MASELLRYPMPTGRMTRPRRAPSSAPSLLQVMRPWLPPAEELLPYLAEIDKRRWYSNSGPLVTRLEEQLSQQLGFSDPGVVTVANATVGLTVALMAREIPAGSICLMPSWTFAATPHAALAAGLVPWFHDVDRKTWALDLGEVTETLKRIPNRVAAVIVVSPFGAPIDIPAWEEFEDRTGIAVIVDAAAAFDTTRPSRIPLVVSLHATKILGAGEGGFLATTDARVRDRTKACCNFGFAGSRNAMLPAMNAKMSEYHAAVALASFAHWPEIRRRHARINEWYRQGVAQVEGVALQPQYGEGWVTNTTSVVLPAGSRRIVASVLSQLGIETRGWWGEGCHVQPAFADCPRSALPITEDLGSRVLGLPHSPDTRKSDVDAVVSALAQALEKDTGRRSADLSNLAEALAGDAPVPVNVRH